MVNAPGCGSGIRGFKPHHPPHNEKAAPGVFHGAFIICKFFKIFMSEITRISIISYRQAGVNNPEVIMNHDHDISQIYPLTLWG